MSRSAVQRGIRIVDRLGIALVYPIEGKVELRSLWSELHPKAKMEWSWNEDADPRVAEVWHLRERLARSHDVAYAKWFRGRATLFSLPVFHALLGRLAAAGDVFARLPPESVTLLELLRERSPLSTKELRTFADLRGKEHEAVFTRAMKVLWSRLLVVGIGEVEDGAFPSLAVGATELLFEDIWNARRNVPADAAAALDAALEVAPDYRRELLRTVTELGSRRAPKTRSSRRAEPTTLEPPPPRRSRRSSDAPFNEPSAAEVFGRERPPR
jgi:hypothetical protein